MPRQLVVAVVLLALLVGGASAAELKLVKNDFQYANYYMPMRIALQETPPFQLKAEPQYVGTPLYGVLKMGNAPDNQLVVVVDEKLDEKGQGDRRIYIDRNNDKDLTNDGDGKWEKDTQGNVATSVDVTVAIVDGATTTTEVYPLSVYRFKDRPQFAKMVFYYRNYARVGEVEIDAKPVKIVLLDDNSDGLFSDLSAPPAEGPTGAFAIDLNGDGKANCATNSAEYYKAGESFSFNGKSWKLGSVSANGANVTIVPSDVVVAPKLSLEVGTPAADFEATDLEGKPVKLSDYKGKVVLLDFWASWCGPCVGELPKVIETYKKYHDQGFEILGISLDKTVDDLTKFLGQNPDMTWRQVCDGKYWQAAIGQLYRIDSIPAPFVLDQKGIIVARDNGARGDNLGKVVGKLLGAGGGQP